MARIRSIKPAFFKDPVVSRLSPGCRLFYVGLWTVADDAGWLEWSVPWIGAELYPYETVKRRERDIEKWEKELILSGRLKVGECGHATIVHFREHQHLAGATRRVETAFNQHREGECPHPRQSPPIPAGGGGNPPMPTNGEAERKDTAKTPNLRKPAAIRGNPQQSAGIGDV